jgi:Yip1 domain/zinc-ribbon domain
LFCPQCGTVNADDAQFCSKCGAALKTESSSSSPPSSNQNPPSVPNISFGTIPGGPATFAPGNAISNAINLVKSPAAFMQQNQGQNLPWMSTITGYVAILAAIPFIATLIGDLWYYHVGAVVGYAVVYAILTYILDIVAVFVIGYIVWKLAPSFGTSTTQDKATLLAAFAYTPVFLISIVDIIPFLGFLTILGLLYGLYILYIGIPIMLSTPKDRTLVYFIVIVLVALIVYAVIGAIISAIAVAAFLGTFH